MKRKIVMALIVLVSFAGTLAAQEEYRYLGEYREELPWSEEIIDQVNHSVYSAGIEPKFFFGTRGALTLAGGYLATGPLRTDLAESGELNDFWGRLGYSAAF